MTTTNQKPSVGRIVHYYDDSPATQPLAAIITHVLDDGVVHLQVFDYALTVGSGRQLYCTYSEEPAPFRWTWPPRV